MEVVVAAAVTGVKSVLNIGFQFYGDFLMSFFINHSLLICTRFGSQPVEYTENCCQINL